MQLIECSGLFLGCCSCLLSILLYIKKLIRSRQAEGLSRV